jgi:hypothetical protein
MILALCLAPAAAVRLPAVQVSTTTELVDAVAAANAGGDPLIELADGTYTLDDMLIVTAGGVTVRGLSGDREAVIVEGRGMWGPVTHCFNVAGHDFSCRDMTLRRVANHAIQLAVDTDRLTVSNVHILDTFEQMIKAPYDAGHLELTCDAGLVENCRFEYSAGIGPQYYIGGVDCHNARDWVIRGNTFIGIRSPSAAIAEHAVHFWSGSEDTLVEGNLIINCDRGIGFGLGDRGHVRGIIRNNMIYHDASEGFADVGIAVETSVDTEICNNTVIQLHAYPNAIEYRFPATSGTLVANNLVNRAIAARDGATGTEQTNVESALPGWFVDPPAGDLHLATAIASVVDQGTTVPGLTDDFDGHKRPLGAGIDIGADEWVPPAGTVSVSLACTPAAGTLPLTVRFQSLLENTAAGESRRLAGRISAELAGGLVIANWRAGWTNLGPGESRLATWLQPLPASGQLDGASTFTLWAADVTPPPYNEPPYTPSGDTAANECTVTGVVP